MALPIPLDGADPRVSRGPDAPSHRETRPAKSDDGSLDGVDIGGPPIFFGIERTPFCPNPKRPPPS